MIRGGFRPWGLLPWLLSKLPRNQWWLLGAIATGDRCLAAWKTINSLGQCAENLMLQINDIRSPYWGDEPQCRVDERKKEFIASGGREDNICICDIRDNLSEINQIIDKPFFENGKNLIIDISCLPKKFFFPILRRIIDKSEAETIIATYTRPERYDTSKPLSRDPGPWKALPGFHEVYPPSRDIRQMLVAALGYEPLGLPQIIKEGEFSPDRIRLLFPFPASPAGYLKNWEFVRNIDSESGSYYHRPIRVNGYDLSSTFDCILYITNNGEEFSVLAPYGTKPMSLAMCLFYIYNSEKTSVYYTQPNSYNPLYSTGVKHVNGVPETYGYCIRLNNQDLYKI